MKSLLLATIGIVLSVGAVTAQSKATDAYADGFTVEQATSIYVGLQQLTKTDGVDKDGKPSLVYFKFTGNVRVAVAANLDAGSRVQTILQSANTSLIAEIASGAGKVPDEKVGEYNVALRKILEAPCRCSFIKIKLDDLKIDDNPIPVTVLGAIWPIIDR